MADREWWRGTGLETRPAGRQALEQEVAAGSEGLLHDQMFIGVAAYKIIRGAKQQPEAVAALLAQMVVDCEAKIRAHTRELLQAIDPGSEPARKAHFEARVAAGIVGLLNDYVRQAETAERTFNHPGE